MSMPTALLLVAVLLAILAIAVLHLIILPLAFLPCSCRLNVPPIARLLGPLDLLIQESTHLFRGCGLCKDKGWEEVGVPCERDVQMRLDKRTNKSVDKGLDVAAGLGSHRIQLVRVDVVVLEPDAGQLRSKLSDHSSGIVYASLEEPLDVLDLMLQRCTFLPLLAFALNARAGSSIADLQDTVDRIVAKELRRTGGGRATFVEALWLYQHGRSVDGDGGIQEKADKAGEVGGSSENSSDFAMSLARHEHDRHDATKDQLCALWLRVVRGELTVSESPKPARSTSASP